MSNRELLIDACTYLRQVLRHNDFSKPQTDVHYDIETAGPFQSFGGRYKSWVRISVDRVIVFDQRVGMDTADEAEDLVCYKALMELVAGGIMNSKQEIDRRKLGFPPDKIMVYKALESERDYQDAMEDKEGSHVTSALNMGGILSAIKVNLDRAMDAWYGEQTPYPKTTDFLRKIGGLCIKAGEMYGMAGRTMNKGV